MKFEEKFGGGTGGAGVDRGLAGTKGGGLSSIPPPATTPTPDDDDDGDGDDDDDDDCVGSATPPNDMLGKTSSLSKRRMIDRSNTKRILSNLKHHLIKDTYVVLRSCIETLQNDRLINGEQERKHKNRPNRPTLPSKCTI